MLFMNGGLPQVDSFDPKPTLDDTMARLRIQGDRKAHERARQSATILYPMCIDHTTMKRHSGRSFRLTAFHGNMVDDTSASSHVRAQML